MWSVVHFPFTCTDRQTPVYKHFDSDQNLRAKSDRPMPFQDPHLDEDLHVLQIVSVPLVKGLQQLQAVALRVDVHLEAAAISRRVLVGVLARVKVPGWEFISIWGLQFELLPAWGCKVISLRVEV